MPDTGQDIDYENVPNTVQGLIELQEDTQDRFTFAIEPSGLIAVCSWVNYFKNGEGKRVKNAYGAYILDEYQKKTVVLQVE